MIGNITPTFVERQLNRPVRPKSQDATLRSRSPALRGFYLGKQEVQLPEVDDESEVNHHEVISESDHQYTCPWNKARKLRSRERIGKDDLHPRPWGARSPDDIQCTCKISKNDPRRTVKPSSVTPPLGVKKTPGHFELSRALDNACKQIDKVKVSLTKEEVNEFSKKIRTSLEKKVTVKNTDKKAGKRTLSAQSPKYQTQTKLFNQKQMNQTSGNVDNMIISNGTLQPTMHMTPTAVVGTMESTNYVIELSAQPRNNHSGEIKNIMSQVIPLPMNNEHKPRLVNLDGTYFAEIPNDFGVVPTVNQVRSDSAVIKNRMENLTLFASADRNKQNIVYAKPKSFSNSAFVTQSKLHQKLNRGQITKL